MLFQQSGKASQLEQELACSENQKAWGHMASCQSCHIGEALENSSQKLERSRPPHVLFREEHYKALVDLLKMAKITPMVRIAQVS